MNSTPWRCDSSISSCKLAARDKSQAKTRDGNEMSVREAEVRVWGSREKKRTWTARRFAGLGSVSFAALLALFLILLAALTIARFRPQDQFPPLPLPRTELFGNVGLAPVGTVFAVVLGCIEVGIHAPALHEMEELAPLLRLPRPAIKTLHNTNQHVAGILHCKGREMQTQERREWDWLRLRAKKRKARVTYNKLQQ